MELLWKCYLKCHINYPTDWKIIFKFNNICLEVFINIKQCKSKISLHSLSELALLKEEGHPLPPPRPKKGSQASKASRQNKATVSAKSCNTRNTTQHRRLRFMVGYTSKWCNIVYTNAKSSSSTNNGAVFVIIMIIIYICWNKSDAIGCSNTSHHKQTGKTTQYYEPRP